MWEKIKIMSSGVWLFVLPFLRSMMKQAGPILAAAALSAVKAAATNTGASGTEKRAAALDSIGKELQSQGIKIGVDVSTSLINAALEMAVQKLKE
jgi:hypothetical protein